MKTNLWKTAQSVAGTTDSRVWLTFACAAWLAAAIQAQAGVPALLPYQGKVLVSGTPFTGTGQFKFSLVNSNGSVTWWSNDGSGAGGAEPGTAVALPVNTGLYSLHLGDTNLAHMLALPPDVFTNDRVHLRVWFNDGSTGFQRLDPDQRVGAGAYAFWAGSVPATALGGAYPNAVTLSNAANVFAGSGAGLANVNAATVGGVVASNLWNLGGNAGTTPGTHFLGTTDNQQLEVKVNNRRALRLEPGGLLGVPNLVGGYAGNLVSNGVAGAAIGGGGQPFVENRVGGDFGTIGGGIGNVAVESIATIGGGERNHASGAATVAGGQDNQALSLYATIAGGVGNRATNFYATIGGGSFNTAGASAATVGGGSGNLSSGQLATVPGGMANEAAGAGSLAAGKRARALHDGTFVWSDWLGTDFASTSSNQFLIRASGGVGIGTDDPAGAALRVAGVVSADGFSGSGAGLSNLNAAVVGGVAASNLWKLDGNPGTAPGTHFLGTTDNQPLEFRVANARALRLVPVFFEGNPTVNLVGGSADNIVSNGVVGGTISGGGALLHENRVGGNFATVSGGFHNVARGEKSTIGGGEANSAREFGTVGGGVGNTAGGNATVGGGEGGTASGVDSTVSGGNHNTASGVGASVGGGNENTASDPYTSISGGWHNSAIGEAATVGGGSENGTGGWFATVPGGRKNWASGDYSFAAGYWANAAHAGAFVWADAIESPLHSSTSNQFRIRATGGCQFFTDNTASTGASLAPGSGSWTSMSDRNRKENFASVSGLDVLEKVAAMPLQTWNYKSQDAAIRHIGPTAQDFKAAFGLGESETGIATVDADGVALAAIQGLNQKLEAELRQKADELSAVKARQSELEKKLAELERILANTTQK